MIMVCRVCGCEIDTDELDVPFENLPADWVCPVCGVGKEEFDPKE